MSKLYSSVRKTLIIAGSAMLVAFSSAAQDITTMTASEIAEKIASAELTSVEVVNAYLTRIEQLDKNGPSIQSVITLNPQALELAQQKDAAVKAGQELGPLHH